MCLLQKIAARLVYNFHMRCFREGSWIKETFPVASTIVVDKPVLWVGTASAGLVLGLAI